MKAREVNAQKKLEATRERRAQNKQERDERDAKEGGGGGGGTMEFMPLVARTGAGAGPAVVEVFSAIGSLWDGRRPWTCDRLSVLSRPGVSIALKLVYWHLSTKILL